jgi:uncharacterized RDD family membrane protein YckC
MPSAFIVRGDDGEEYGPVTFEELRGWVRENRAGLGTNVRTDEPGSLWQPWQYYPELVALLAEARSTGLSAGVIRAPMIRRMAAMIVDLFLISVLLIIPMKVVYLLFPAVFLPMQAAFDQGQIFAAMQLPPQFEAMLNLIFYGMVVLYMAGFHALHGRTPAKSLMRLQVVDQRGTKPSFGAAFLRGLVLSFSLCLAGLPLLWAFFNPQRRALHDLMAGTYVVEL